MNAKVWLFVIGILVGAAGMGWLAPRGGADSAPASSAAGRDSDLPAPSPARGEASSAMAGLAAEVASTGTADRRIELIAAAAAAEPRLAVELAERLADPSERARAMHVAILAWASADPSAALDHAAGMARSRERTESATLVLESWAALDPASAIEALNAVQPALALDERSLLNEIARFSPLTILDNYSSLSDEARAAGLTAALARLAESDSEAAIGYLALARTPDERGIAVGAIASGWARNDPAAALEWVGTQDDVGGMSFAGIVASVAESDPAAAFAFVLDGIDDAMLQERALDQLMLVLLRADRELDPLELSPLELLDRSLRLPEERQFVLRPLFRQWFRARPEDAMQWLSRNANVVPTSLFFTVSSQMTNTGFDPTVVAAYIDSVPASARDEWIERIGMAYARQDPDAGIAWLDRFQGQPEYAAAVRGVGMTLTQTSPRDAVALLSRGALPAREKSLLISAAFRTWAQWDPAAAIDWMSGVSDPAELDAIMPALAGGLVASSPERSGDWVLQLPPGFHRDQALGAVVAAIMQSSSVDARELLRDGRILSGFSSDRRRQETLAASFQSMPERNRALARELIDAYLTDSELRETAERGIARQDIPRLP